VPACLPACLPGCLPACLPTCLPACTNNVCVPACVRTCVLATYTQASPPPTHKPARYDRSRIRAESDTRSTIVLSLSLVNGPTLDRIAIVESRDVILYFRTGGGGRRGNETCLRCRTFEGLRMKRETTGRNVSSFPRQILYLRYGRPRPRRCDAATPENS